MCERGFILSQVSAAKAFLFLLSQTQTPPPTITVDDVEQQLQVVLGLLHQIPRLNKSNTHTTEILKHCLHSDILNQTMFPLYFPLKLEKSYSVSSNVLFQLVPALFNQMTFIHISIKFSLTSMIVLDSKIEFCGFEQCLNSVSN